jgi:mRNA interferase MazF
VWWVAFGPSSGGEVRKERPALIISNDPSDRHLNRVQVVPFTSNVERVYPSEAVVALAGKPAKAMADQLATVSKARLIDLVGRLSPPEIRRVERAVAVQLGLGDFASTRD